ncbi:MAG: phosphoglycerate kinase, partial [Phycisphaerae bacterium]|nr:phosphoglycerate kinase [Phycisphaerae bacterium]
MAKTVDQLNVKGKKVLVRVDFNVPQDKVTCEITDDRRIKAALPTIKSVLSRGGRAILMSHLGRPEGTPDDVKLTLAPIAKRVSELLGQPVPLAPGHSGPEVKKLVDALKDGQAILLENLRFNGSVVEMTKKDKKTGEVKV